MRVWCSRGMAPQLLLRTPTSCTHRTSRLGVMSQCLRLPQETAAAVLMPGARVLNLLDQMSCCWCKRTSRWRRSSTNDKSQVLKQQILAPFLFLLSLSLSFQALVVSVAGAVHMHTMHRPMTNVAVDCIYSFVCGSINCVRPTYFALVCLDVDFISCFPSVRFNFLQRATPDVNITHQSKSMLREKMTA